MSSKDRANKKAKKVVRKALAADRAVTHRAGAAKDHGLVQALGPVSELGDQPPLVALSAATLVAGAALRKPAVARAGARMLLAHALATGVKAVLKASVDRTRPHRAMTRGHKLEKGSGTDDSSLNSFPSGHTAGAVAVAEAVARESASGALPARAAAATIAALQPPRRSHYVLDVLAGGAIGWLSERVASALLDAGEARLRAALTMRGERQAEEEAAAHPS